MTDELTALRELIARANHLLQRDPNFEEFTPEALEADLGALMEAKALVRRLNVVSHAVACALCVHLLADLHPDVTRWRQVPGAGAGRDVEGFLANGDPAVVAEVKTTLLSLGDRPGADQIKNWRKDFDRLVGDQVAVRYFVVPTEKVAVAARRLAPVGVRVLSLLPDP